MGGCPVKGHQGRAPAGQARNLRTPAVLTDDGGLDDVATPVDRFFVSDQLGSRRYRCHGSATNCAAAPICAQAKDRTNLHHRVPSDGFA
jgi:hypothetical protein